MSPLEQQSTQVENTRAGSQQAAASQNLMSEYMATVPSLAQKIETTNITSPDTRHDLALTFENIYTAAGGGAAGTAAEDTFQKSLNDKLKADGSKLQIDTVHSAGLFALKQNGYAIVEKNGDQLRSSGVIEPERADAQYKADLAAIESDKQKYSASAQPDTAAKGAEASIPSDSQFSFTDPKTEQAYIQAAGDVAKVLSNPASSTAEKQKDVLDALNAVGVHDKADLDNFKYELGQKLGPNAKIDTRPSVSMTFHSSITIDTGDNKPIEVPFKMSGGKLVSTLQ